MTFRDYKFYQYVAAMKKEIAGFTFDKFISQKKRKEN